MANIPSVPSGQEFFQMGAQGGQALAGSIQSAGDWAAKAYQLQTQRQQMEAYQQQVEAQRQEVQMRMADHVHQRMRDIVVQDNGQYKNALIEQLQEDTQKMGMPIHPVTVGALKDPAISEKLSASLAAMSGMPQEQVRALLPFVGTQDFVNQIFGLAKQKTMAEAMGKVGLGSVLDEINAGQAKGVDLTKYPNLSGLATALVSGSPSAQALFANPKVQNELNQFRQEVAPLIQAEMAGKQAVQAAGIAHVQAETGKIIAGPAQTALEEAGKYASARFFPKETSNLTAKLTADPTDKESLQALNVINKRSAGMLEQEKKTEALSKDKFNFIKDTRSEWESKVYSDYRPALDAISRIRSFGNFTGNIPSSVLIGASMVFDQGRQSVLRPGMVGLVKGAVPLMERASLSLKQASENGAGTLTAAQITDIKKSTDIMEGAVRAQLKKGSDSYLTTISEYQKKDPSVKPGMIIPADTLKFMKGESTKYTPGNIVTARPITPSAPGTAPTVSKFSQKQRDAIQAERAKGTAPAQIRQMVNQSRQKIGKPPITDAEAKDLGL